MKCNFCGKEIKDGSVFCKFCGSKIEPVAEKTVLPVADIRGNASLFCDDKSEKCASKEMNAMQNTEENTTEKVSSVISCQKEEGKTNPLSSREKRIMVVFSGIIVCLLIVIITLLVRPISTKSEGQKDTDMVLNSSTDSILTSNDAGINPSESNKKTVPATNDLENAQSVSFGFIDYTMFSEHWTEGMYRCGTDFSAGEYYILSLWGAAAIYDVADSPNDISWSNYRMFRKVTAKEGQYIQLSHGSLMVTSEEFKNHDLKEYGIFLVGKDLSAGDYKVTTITDQYNTDLYNVSGVWGGYQISNNNPENDPEKCSPLFDGQTYISVEDGQYIILANANMVFAGA